MSDKNEGREETPEEKQEETEAKHPEDNMEWVNTFEDLLELVGTKGPWNVLIFFLCSLSSFVSPMYQLSYQFLGATPDYWCHVAPLVEANWTQEQILTLAIPYRNKTGKYDGCHMYDYNYTAAVEIGYEASVSGGSAFEGGNGTLVKCLSRTFNHTQYKSTVVTEWDLVCERRIIYSTTQAAVQGGILLGSLIFGFLIDTWGRRPVVLLCSVINIATALLNAASPTIEVYIFLRVLITFSSSGQYLALFVYAMETYAAKYRAMVGALFTIPWALGYMVVPWIAYLVRTWKLLQIAYSIPGLYAIIYFWWLPESPRWLIIRGRNQEALKILTWAAKVNCKVLPPDHIVLAAMEKIGCQTALVNSKSATETGNSFLPCASSLLKHIFILYIIPQLRVRALVILFCWFAAALVYFGVALGATNLSADLYMYTFLGGVLEIPSYLLLWPALVFIGRKKSLVALYLVCGISIMLVMILMIFFPTGTEGTVVFLAQTGKLAVTAALELIWMFTSELFPTEYRSLALGEANILAKVGSISSPYINDILGEHIVWAPSALFGLVSLLAAALTLLLPETGHVDMPEINDFIKKDEGVNDIDMNDINQGITNATFASDTPRMEQPQVSSAK